MSACVAPGWPECVYDEDGTWWVRLDLEAQAPEVTEPFGRQYELRRLCRNLMARVDDAFSPYDEALEVVYPAPSPLVAGWYEPYDCAVYVRFEEREAVDA